MEQLISFLPYIILVIFVSIFIWLINKSRTENSALAVQAKEQELMNNR